MARFLQWMPTTCLGMLLALFFGCSDRELAETPPAPAPEKELDAWNKFLTGASDNVLLDFSYAGYHHGEEAPLDGFSLGYEVINVKERMEAKGNMVMRWEQP